MIAAYQSRPSAIAWPLDTPSGTNNRTNIASRTPSPLIDNGRTWTIDTTGTTTKNAANGTPRSSAPAISATDTTTENW